MDEENLNEVPSMEEENDEGVILSLTNEDGSDLNFEFLLKNLKMYFFYQLDYKSLMFYLYLLKMENSFYSLYYDYIFQLMKIMVF